jgi:hypothetical protein
MLEEIIWFAIGFVMGRWTSESESVRKVQKMAQKCTDVVKEEFKGKKGERNEILFRRFSL